MQVIDNVELNSATPLFAPIPTSDSPADLALSQIRMRAIRRKARRIGALARFSIAALNALAGEVEADIAGLSRSVV